MNTPILPASPDSAPLPPWTEPAIAAASHALEWAEVAPYGDLRMNSARAGLIAAGAALEAAVPLIAAAALADLATIGSLAEQHEVTRMAVHKWISRYPSFPAPVLTLADIRVYSRAQVAAWRTRHCLGNQPGRVTR